MDSSSADSAKPESQVSEPTACDRTVNERPGSERPVNERAASDRPTKLAALQVQIGYEFKDMMALERALTHRSMHTQSGESDYERLEFLGDAVIDLGIAHLLLDQHPQAREGELSKMRAALVNTQSLASIAKEIGLPGLIRLSRGEQANGGGERASILADVVEALVGAVYRDADFVTAFDVIQKIFGNAISSVAPRDPKTELQEALHVLNRAAPEYLLECVEGPEHAPTFISVVKIDGTIMGRGRGPTKKAAQQEAAAEALLALAPVAGQLSKGTT